MSECKGLFGKLCGHHFKSYLVKSKRNPLDDLCDLKMEGDSVFRYLELQRDVYEIRCKRCGCKAETVRGLTETVRRLTETVRRLTED